LTVKDACNVLGVTEILSIFYVNSVMFACLNFIFVMLFNDLPLKNGGIDVLEVVYLPAAT